jgi:hypothetical protein
MPVDPTHKGNGDLIKSKDWNDILDELVYLRKKMDDLDGLDLIKKVPSLAEMIGKQSESIKGMDKVVGGLKSEIYGDETQHIVGIKPEIYGDDSKKIVGLRTEINGDESKGIIGIKEIQDTVNLLHPFRPTPTPTPRPNP